MTGISFLSIVRGLFVLVVVTLLAWLGQDMEPVPFSTLIIGLIPACLLVLALVIRFERRQAHVRLARFEQADERIAEFVRINKELTRELLESRQLEEAQLLQVRALDAFLQGVIITDPNRPGNPIIFVNEGFTRLTGYSKREVLGRDCRFLQGVDTNPSTVTLIHEAIASERPCTVEILNYRKDGTSFWNSLSIAPIIEDGLLTNYVGVLTDVTALRKMEQQLRHASKMEAIGHLAGGVAHDFNNLLTIINGSCEMLRYGPALDHEHRNLISEIEKAGQRAATMTRQLLTFSRKAVLQPRVLSLNELISEFQKLLVRLIGEDIQLVPQLQPRLSNVKIDQGQMEQALMNLVVNARDAMPRGGRLTIATREESIDTYSADTLTDLDIGRYVCLSVSDTGCGMDEATLARVFEPFFTTKPVGQGTGLGLAMVYGFVKASGGAISVKSEVNVGTTFTIRLPVVNETARLPRPSSANVQPRGTETVLLAEDEEGVRKFAAEVLRAHGYHVLSAAHGREALQLLEANRHEVHLLLTDVVMPYMSGRELAEHVRVVSPETRVIFMSGYTNDAVLQRGVREEESDFMQKPFNIEHLLVKVREVLDRNPSVEETVVGVA